MRHLLKIVLAAAVAVMLTAGMGGGTTAAPSGSIEGNVRADDGEGISGALVRAYGWDTGLMMGEARTATDGTYTIDGLGFARYRVKAEARGYFPEYYRDGAPMPVLVIPQSTTDNVDFLLSPGGYISGWVYRADGRTPIEGARVEAYQEAGGAWEHVASSYADQKGSYSMTVAMAGGTYRVRAQAAGYAAEYYVGFFDTAEATDIHLGDGGHVLGVNFYLDQVGFISGTVYDADGMAPIAAGHVVAYDNATGASVAEGFCEARGGRYYVNLGPGTYRLKAEADGYLAEWYAEVTAFGAASPVSVAELNETAGIDFTLKPDMGVRTYPAAVSDASVRLNGRLTSLGTASDCTASFVWGAGSGSYTHETPGAIRASTGFFSFVLDDLVPGMTYYYKAKAVSDADPVYGEEMRFRARDTTAPVIARLKCDTTASTAVISWTTKEPASSRIDFGVTDAYGSSTGENPDLVTSFSVTLSSLSPETTYHYRIIVGDSSRNRSVSDDHTFKTAEYYGGMGTRTWKILGFAVAGLMVVALGFVWVKAR